MISFGGQLLALLNEQKTQINKQRNTKQLLDEVEHDIVNYQNLVSVSVRIQ